MLDIICCDCGDHPRLDCREVPWWQELNDDEDHNGDDLGRRGISPGGQVMQRRTPSSEVVKILAEATLVSGAVLRCFPDRVASTAGDLRLCLRLLGIGLPLAIGLGTLLAFIVPEVSDIWRALAIGTALAPTDAGLRRGHDGQPGGPGPGSGG
jgi:hypothetical protein